MSSDKIGQKGFTLLEVMVSMAIMAIALVTIIQLFSGALRSAKVSHDYSLAIICAKRKMDEIFAVTKMEEFNDLVQNGEFEDEILKGYEWEIIPPELYKIPEALANDVEEESGSLEDIRYKLYKVGVKVKWKSRASVKELTFTSLKMLEEED